MTTYNEANKISIKAYLANRGIHPVKDHGYYGMYRSPFREDNNASLKVDYNKNLWIDFGSNDGGTMIDLIMRINRCTLNDAMQIACHFVCYSYFQDKYSCYFLVFLTVRLLAQYLQF